MLPEQTAISEFKVYLASLATEERRLSEELQKVQNTIAAVQQAMNGYSGWRAQHPVDEIVKQPQVVADDIARCSGQNEALVVIAKKEQWICKVTASWAIVDGCRLDEIPRHQRCWGHCLPTAH